MPKGDNNKNYLRKEKTYEEIYGKKKAKEVRRNHKAGIKKSWTFERKEVMSKWVKEFQNRPEVKKRQREANLGDKNPIFGKISYKKDKSNIELYGKEEARRIGKIISKTHKGKIDSDLTKEKKKIAHIKLWQNEEYAKMIFASMKKQPNKLEIYFNNFLQTEFSNQFKYVGDGYTWIAGKCPDFIDFENKLIIELFGSYWHKTDEVVKRILHFAKYGYKTLVVWDYELKDLVLLKDKILKFIKNGNKNNKYKSPQFPRSVRDIKQKI